MNYKKITRKQLEKQFKINKYYNKHKLKYKNGKNLIFIKIPFILNEDCAKLAGMMPDGSLIKDLMRIYLTQKKDTSKLFLFKKIIVKLFSPKNKIFIRENQLNSDAYINSQTLAIFFFYILGINKSDEMMRVPKWIFKSPKSVKITYLQQAFDMEGTILKSLNEIRFITKDKLFALDLQKLLFHIDIKSTVNPRIGGIRRTLQYRISVYGKENFKKFKEIGFRIPFLKNRFKELIKKHNI